jgi:orotate phosphoribosyltransferase
MQFKKSNLIALFEKENAILRGHFVLSSGLHSDTYLQCALGLSNTKLAQKIGKNLAKLLKNLKANLVVSPAMGGVVIGYELARNLGINAIFCERVDGKFELRRGFSIPENAKIIVAEDVITTGKSSKETFNLINQIAPSAKIVALSAIFNRSGEKSLNGVPIVSLADIEIKTYNQENLPTHLKNVPAIKPGSRWIKK